MRVSVEGETRGQSVRYAWDILDRFDERTGLRSMSRTTAFPATIVARLLAEGRFRRPGVHAPETIGAEENLLETVLGELEERGVRCRARVERLALEPEEAGQPA